MLTEEDKKWIAEQIAGVHLDMKAMEQRIIKSFRDWQVSVAPRLQADAVLIGSFESRLAIAERRLDEIEFSRR